MNENENPFQEIVNELEDQFGAALLEKRGAFAVAVAAIAGIVYREAVANGVPADLAKAMAAEYWESETSPAYVVTMDQEDDDE